MLRRLVFGGAPGQSLVGIQSSQIRYMTYPGSIPWGMISYNQLVLSGSLSYQVPPIIYPMSSHVIQVVLHQPGRIGQASKRFAVNVGEGAIGSEQEPLRYQVPSNKSQWIIILFKCSLKRVSCKVLALDWCCISLFQINSTLHGGMHHGSNHRI